MSGAKKTSVGRHKFMHTGRINWRECGQQSDRLAAFGSPPSLCYTAPIAGLLRPGPTKWKPWQLIVESKSRKGRYGAFPGAGRPPLMQAPTGTVFPKSSQSPSM
ncbi:hypothetical protein IF1G_03629 [Cordyceps javanica]|uniref:Uncharacterized protein n=1 Tax=Cordyceps javanica TaxID=43265 RepID=A0A545V843_9HYPO|nr:hypothetical protein IF1G_03629 [Cordyceps javanica]